MGQPERRDPSPCDIGKQVPDLTVDVRDVIADGDRAAFVVEHEIITPRDYHPTRISAAKRIQT